MIYKTFCKDSIFGDISWGYVQIPDLIMEACAGHGKGAEELSEFEGNILKSLLAAEQGAVKIKSVKDIVKNEYWGYDPENCGDEIIRTNVTVEDLKSSLDSLFSRGYLTILKYKR